MQEFPFWLNALLLGVGATLVMDIWALAQKVLLGIPSLSYPMVGRWIGHLPKGKLIHSPIGASATIKGEAWLGWGAHYLIGIIFAAILLAICGSQWLQAPKIMPALLLGIISVLAPFLILQPGLGAGLAARRTPAPWTARGRSLLAHTVFGLGLYLTALLLSLL
ncbi:hypothetical protein AYI74_08470 [Shewanella algae]|uniref:DUF2938 domain-containing protein n=1 Tax=Shewanella algae TaxID=38313 RepID=UPI000D14C284|nr:DUF2938 domain-containing protein [Shewanella algae]MBO2686757.1 DUF2938 domain-containing protein [Shewanella algae]PST68615.1 hypothetical protein AYI77_00445 [Shewanella algae]TWU68771.1 hypothetical protein AYI74_08470 [Shewanella algae]